LGNELCHLAQHTGLDLLSAIQVTMKELAQFAETIKRCGATCSPEDFHAAVNLIFHKWESSVYDELHRDMWESLPEQFRLLVADYLSTVPDALDSLHLLDVGCGTGLASECLLRTDLARRIRSIDLLDTSASMLYRASERAKSWNAPFRCIEGQLGSATVSRERYNVILSCSVLHHVVDLSAFLNAIRSLQEEGDIFIHLQDPNGDYLADRELNARMKQATQGFTSRTSRLHPRRILGRLYRELTGKEREDYISRTNRELLDNRIIKSRLTVPELFSITDIRVHDGRGVALSEIRDHLPDYELISQRSYGFFGQLSHSLPVHLKKVEESEIAAHSLNGFHLGAVWMKTANRIE
jgi:2-polyprenyl-3-methyl-5-hydroxy-6-metoxy-1,4-benzoquinol methylase